MTVLHSSSQLAQTCMRGVFRTDAGLSRERATNALFWDLFSSSSCRVEVMLILVHFRKESSFSDFLAPIWHLKWLHFLENVHHASQALSLLQLSCGYSFAGAMAGAPGHAERKAAIPNQQSEMHCVLQ